MNSDSAEPRPHHRDLIDSLMECSHQGDGYRSALIHAAGQVRAESPSVSYIGAINSLIRMKSIMDRIGCEEQVPLIVGQMLDSYLEESASLAQMAVWIAPDSTAVYSAIMQMCVVEGISDYGQWIQTLGLRQMKDISDASGRTTVAVSKLTGQLQRRSLEQVGIPSLLSECGDPDTASFLLDLTAFACSNGYDMVPDDLEAAILRFSKLVDETRHLRHSGIPFEWLVKQMRYLRPSSG